MDEEEAGPTVAFWTGSLFSKWGFWDGSPEPVYDAIPDDLSVPLIHHWNRVCRRIVREYMLPRLDQKVECYDIDTSHNPIRAESVDGRGVPEYIISTAVDARDEGFVITPEHIDVPVAFILKVLEECREVGQGTHDAGSAIDLKA